MWILAARPATLPAAAAPVLVGTACAHAVGGLRWGPALAALVGACALQIGTNFVNDAADFARGADTDERLGPIRAVQAGWITPRAMYAAAVAAFAGAACCGLYLSVSAGWPVIAIGVCAILAGVAYTAGPYPLGYHGLGDLFVFVFFGVVAVVGTTYVQIREISTLAVWASLPVGALCTNILVVNNARDREGDRQIGKRTLAARFGKGFAIAQYGALLLLAFACAAWIGRDHRGAWLSWASAPLALVCWWQLATRDGVELNPVLGRSARTLLLFSALLSLGVVL